jgi:hypothetical protein
MHGDYVAFLGLRDVPEVSWWINLWEALADSMCRTDGSAWTCWRTSLTGWDEDVFPVLLILRDTKTVTARRDQGNQRGRPGSMIVSPAFRRITSKRHVPAFRRLSEISGDLDPSDVSRLRRILPLRPTYDRISRWKLPGSVAFDVEGQKPQHPEITRSSGELRIFPGSRIEISSVSLGRFVDDVLYALQAGHNPDPLRHLPDLFCLL